MTVTLERVTRAVDGIPTIQDVSLTLERGTLSVLLGPTFVGKTSIMRLLAGLDKPTTGRVLVDGKDVTGFDVRQRSVAMVYQQFINYPSFTVYENIVISSLMTRESETLELRHNILTILRHSSTGSLLFWTSKNVISLKGYRRLDQCYRVASLMKRRRALGLCI